MLFKYKNGLMPFLFHYLIVGVIINSTTLIKKTLKVDMILPLFNPVYGKLLKQLLYKFVQNKICCLITEKK